jgi:5-methylcytosine-specific restriction endonuclease McrA
LVAAVAAILSPFVLATCWRTGGSAAEYVEHHPHEATPSSVVDELFGAPRSSQWPRVRAAHLAIHPACEACGTRDDLNVHHVLPFHSHPERELDPTNLITLCRHHHLTLGHVCPDGRRNWGECSNPNVRKDAARLRRNPQWETER